MIGVGWVDTVISKKLFACLPPWLDWNWQEQGHTLLLFSSYFPYLIGFVSPFRDFLFFSGVHVVVIAVLLVLMVVVHDMIPIAL